MYIRFGLIVLVVLLLANTMIGCSGVESLATAQPDTVSSPISVPGSAGNVTENIFSSPIFTSPLATSVSLEVVPNPSPGKGTVTGVLILDDGFPRPVQGAILYLGEVIKLEDGRPAMSGLDKRNAPITQTNAAGQFIFKNVPPGEYTLFFDLVVHSFVLSAPVGGDLIIKVTAGEITDLGELRYHNLPGAVQPVPND